MKENPLTTQSVKPLVDRQHTNKATAERFIQSFNHDDWATVRKVVADGFVFHHPIGGTVQAGPEGMVATWAGFKHLSPDSWHPIPILIAEGDYVAVLLPTYGHFTGRSDQAPPPTGGRLDYGMVNVVRFEAGKLAEMWFGMDPLVELQQMGVAPVSPPRHCEPTQPASLTALRGAAEIEPSDFDNVTEPPYGGDPTVDTETSRAVVGRWFEDVLRGHRLAEVTELASPNILIHPTAMPRESGYYAYAGVEQWLEEQWAAFPDLTVVDVFTVASGDIVAVRWEAHGTSRGQFLGIAPTGHSLDYTGLSMYRVEGGRIAEIWETRNTLGIMRQLDPRIGGGHHH
jgi:predicted ester cyclase